MSVMYDRVTGCSHGLTIAHIACPARRGSAAQAGGRRARGVGRAHGRA
jgi:hypothetical protein